MFNTVIFKLLHVVLKANKDLENILACKNYFIFCIDVTIKFKVVLTLGNI